MIGRRRTDFSYLAALAVSIGLSNAAACGATATNATYEIIADGMCCQGCAKNVAAQLYTAPGVTDVTTDVSTRKVTITAKTSPKLTLEKLWNAVEKAKGKPSQLATSQAVYTLTPLDQLKPEEQPAAGVYTLLIAGMHDMKQAERVAAQLRPIRGIESFSVDLAQGALFVKPVPDVQLSPWSLAAATDQAEETAVTVAGPFGRVRIEPVAQRPASAVLSRQPVKGTIQ